MPAGLGWRRHRAHSGSERQEKGGQGMDGRGALRRSPAHAFAALPRKTRSPPECPSPAPARCLLSPTGPGIPGRPAPRSPPGPSPEPQAARPAAGPGVAAALTRPLRRLALAPALRRSWALQTRSPQLPRRRAPSRAAPEGDPARPPRPAPRGPRAAAPHSGRPSALGAAQTRLQLPGGAGLRERGAGRRRGTGVPPPPARPVEGAGGGGSEWPRRWAVPESPPFGRPQACSPSDTMAAPQLFRALVSAQWVAEALRAPRAGQPLQLLDASWYLPKLGRDARREFEERHIPGAAFFDIDQCSDRTSPYDHMLPGAEQFAEYAGRLGVGAATHVVVYDASEQGLYAAPRVWWMFRAFGHRTVSLLDGGLRHWLRQGLPLGSGKSHPAPAEFHAQLDPAFVKTYEDIKENLEARRFQVVDARAAGRFQGTEPEPRDGIEPGHIPGTVNIPFTEFMTPEGLEKSPEEIQRLFQEKKVDLSRPLVATCGSGVTACHVALGAYLCGKPDVPIYDGSWVEWFMRARPEDIISEGRGKTH
uniref:Sulfurtransferase n=2 Tax=Oryctolagus cuniculus TaxID=9986 RepID=G1TED0_RABIT